MFTQLSVLSTVAELFYLSLNALYHSLFVVTFNAIYSASDCFPKELTKYKQFFICFLGYIITIRSKHGKKNYTQLVGNNVHQLLKGGLMQNSTLFITIAARTSKGIGPHSKKISIKLSE